MFETFADVLTVTELCNALHIGKNTAYEYLKNGVIKSIKIGKKYVIPKIYLIDFVNRNR